MLNWLGMLPQSSPTLSAAMMLLSLSSSLFTTTDAAMPNSNSKQLLMQFGTPISTSLKRPTSPSSLSGRIITGRSRRIKQHSCSSRVPLSLLTFTSYDKSTNNNFGTIETATTTTTRSALSSKTSLLSSSKIVNSNNKLPLLILTTVPIAFGSYATAIRLAGPLSDTHALVLQCLTYAVACCAIGIVRLVLYLLHNRQYNTAAATKSKSIMKVTKLEWKSGIQLGLLIAIAATLQSLGLQRTTAIRAGFLVRLSTIFVPLIDSLYIQRKLPSKVMIGALMSSLVGVLLMVLSPTATTVGTGSILLDGTIMNSSTTWVGDILVALSAVFYSTHILRLGVLAPKCNPMSLSITKSLTQLIISQLLLLFSLLVTTIKSFSSSSLSSSIGQQLYIKNIPPILYRIALYTGSVTCAFPMYAQGYGQQYIKSSYASLIYATAPVWNAIIAAVILKERLNTRGMMGAGFLIIGMISAIVASVRDSSD